VGGRGGRRLDVPWSVRAGAPGISGEPRDGRRDPPVSDVDTQGEPGRARERHLAAAKEMKSHAVGRCSLPGDQRGVVQRLMMKARAAPDVRPEPEVVAHGIEESIDHGGLDLCRRETARGDVARPGIPGKPELNAETIVTPRA